MKKIGIVLIMVVLAMSVMSCSKVNSGYVGLKVSLLGSEKGGITELTPGKYYIGINEELFRFPTFNQNYVWTANKAESSPNDESFTFSIDGLRVNIDVGIEYNLSPGQIKDIFVQYRKGVDELTDITIKNIVRDGFNKFSKDYDMNTLISGGMDELLVKVETYVIDTFAPSGINVISLSLVGAPRYPNSVVLAIENKIEATQKAVQKEYELRETTAEAQKVVAEATGRAEALLISTRAEAEAKAMMNTAYTEKILQAMWIQKWDGQLPTYMTGDSDIMMSVK